MRVTTLARRFIGVAGVLLAACDNPARTKSFTLSVSDADVSLGQSGTAIVTIQIARENFEGAVTLAADGLPDGVSATFLPASVTATASTLTLAATGTTLPGSATITIRATGEGVAEQSAPIALTITVTGSFALDPLNGTVTVTEGASVRSAVLVNRVGGYAGTVALSLSGAPAGLTTTLGSPSTTDNSVPVTVAASGVAAGDYTITATGTTPGLSDQQATFTVSVIPAPATASLTMTFCATSKPVWLAYQNEGAGWQVATASGNSFTFSATERLGVAMTFVSQSGANKQVTVSYLLRSEAAARTGRDCGGSHTLTGTVAGVSAAQQVPVVMGAIAAEPQASGSNPAFTLSGVASRALDLVATRGSVANLTGAFTPDKMITRRALEPASASPLAALDFAGAEAFDLQQETLTLANTTQADALTIVNTFWTATSTFGAVQSALPTGTSMPYFGVPAARLIAGDVHELFLDAYQQSASVGRTMLSYFAAPVDRTETFGPIVGIPTVTKVSGVPYVRLRGRLTLQPEYSAAARLAVYQEPGGSSDTRFVIIVTTAGFLGGAPSIWDITVPDFIGLAGFNTSWMPTSGEDTAWQVIGYGGRADLIFEATPAAGDLLRFSDRQGNISGQNLLIVGMQRLPRAQYLSR